MRAAADAPHRKPSCFVAPQGIQPHATVARADTSTLNELHMPIQTYRQQRSRRPDASELLGGYTAMATAGDMSELELTCNRPQ
jgi:hypothetical protein